MSEPLPPPPNRERALANTIAAQARAAFEQLRAQEDLLAMRHLSLDPEVLGALRALRAAADRLTLRLEDASEELAQLRVLAETTALITDARDLDTVLTQVMDTVIALTDAQRGYVVLRGPGGTLDVRVARGEESMDEHAYVVSRTVVNQVAATGEPVLTDNASADSRFDGQNSVIGFALRSILAVPLKVRDSVIGVVYCDNRALAGLFRPHDLTLLSAFADQAAVAIENARLFADLRAQLDEVTATREATRNLYASVASGILTVDARGAITTLNAAAEAMLGQPEATLLGLPLIEVLPDCRDALLDALDTVRRSAGRVVVECAPEVAGQGVRAWTVLVSLLVNAADGVADGWALVLNDLTETRARERQLAAVSGYMPTAGLESWRARTLDAHALDTQVRTVSALFADVRGFTRFSEKLPPEDLMRVINRYLGLAADAINFYDGLVDKYMGDAVTGLFNTPLNPHEDHALRAVRAALNMRFDLLALHEVLPDDQRLFYGVGIATGPVVLGSVGGAGRAEFTALGDTMLACKRLQEFAGPGEVIIDAATHDAVSLLFTCEPLAEAVGIPAAYKVLGRKRGAVTGMLNA